MLMRSWFIGQVYLQNWTDQLVEGANTMLRVAKEILAAQTTIQVNQLLLEDGQRSDQADDSA